MPVEARFLTSVAVSALRQGLNVGNVDEGLIKSRVSGNDKKKWHGTEI